MRQTAISTPAAFLLLLASPADARVTDFDVHATTPMHEGRRFGDAGIYQRIDGVAPCAVTCSDQRVANIVNIDRTPVDDRGDVEFSAEVVILQLTGQGFGTLFHEIPNRGRNLSFPLLNRAPIRDR